MGILELRLQCGVWRSGLVRWDHTEGWDREGGGRGVQDTEKGARIHPSEEQERVRKRMPSCPGISGDRAQWSQAY